MDTGPLVAFLNRRDGHHRWARRILDTIEPPLRTCEAVLSEACFLVRRLERGSDTILELLDRGIVEVGFHLTAEQPAVRKLMRRYADVPMSLADACLVRMAELDTRAVVLTVDRDFRIYRRHGRQAVAVVAPWT